MCIFTLYLLPMRFYLLILSDILDLPYQSGAWGNSQEHAVLWDYQHDKTITTRFEGAWEGSGS